MEATCRVCPFCGQPMGFFGAFPKIDLPPGPLKMLHLLWQFREQIVPYESLRSNAQVAKQFGSNIRQAIATADLPWTLECERDVGLRLHRIN